MMRQKVILVLLALALVSLTGCGSPVKLVTNYKQGFDHVKYSQTVGYKNWVEMPGKEASHVSMRETKEEIQMLRTIDSVEADGTALMSVTLLEVKLSLNIDVQDKKKQMSYNSSEGGTKSDWPGQPKLAGVSYQIRVAPDSSIVEFVNLDKVRKELGLEDSSSGAVANILSDDSLRRYHERKFMINAPKKIAVGESKVINAPLPDAMIKAKAIKETYSVKGVPVEGGEQLVSVIMEGSDLQTLPEGMAEPEGIKEFGRSLIKDKSDMDSLSVTSIGTFDVGKGMATMEFNALSCKLVLLEENVFGEQAKQKKGGGRDNVYGD